MQNIQTHLIAGQWYATAQTPSLPIAGLIAHGSTAQEATNELLAKFNHLINQ